MMDDAVAGDVVVIAYVAEAPVADVVHTASLEIQVPPLRGGGTMDDKQGNGSHLRQRELELKPNAPAMADNTVVMIFKISPSLLLGFWLLERFVLIKIKDLEASPNLPRREEWPLPRPLPVGRGQGIQAFPAFLVGNKFRAFVIIINISLSFK